MLNLDFKNKNLGIVKKFWIFVIVSAVIILAGLVDMLFIRHMNYGVEFSGGMSVEVTYDASLDESKVNDVVDKYFATTSYKVDGEPQHSVAGGERTLTYRLKVEVKGSEGSQIEGDLTKAFGEKATELGDERFDEIEVSSHTISNDVKNRIVRSAVIAVAVAVVVILVYIAIRFNLLAGVAAIIALVHDVLIMFALTTLFQIPVNTTFIAAVITIIGYSINATIVVFDRVRELIALPSYIDKTDAEIAEDAVKGTMSRSILTTLTTLVMIVCLAIFGNASIRDFAFPIIFGLVAGLYSSVLLSASTWVNLRKLFKQENKKPTKKIKKIKEQAKA
ncbi:MAG: protein translocase subunit SecF [Clostridia bacterium]|nr:protein translocase subunit SecF [Clostridia bacterium]